MFVICFCILASISNSVAIKKKPIEKMYVENNFFLNHHYNPVYALLVKKKKENLTQYQIKL